MIGPDEQTSHDHTGGDAHAHDAHGVDAAHAEHHHHAEPQPIDHVVDKYLLGVPTSTGTFPVITMHMITLVAATVLLVWALKKAAAAIETGPEGAGNRRYVARSRWGALVESIVVYLRDEMIKPILGEASTRKYLPFLLTLFFFILFNNLLGLAPLLSIQHIIGGLWGDWHFAIIGGTATGNIAVTAALAIIAFIVIQVHGLRELGIGGWLHHLLGGAPWWLAPLMIPVELMGMIIKPAALAIRLFANMLAGHTMMATLLLFGYMALKAGLGWLVGGAGVGLLSGGFAVVITFLELFVAFLQAFVFMFLTTVFISQLSHHDDHEHEHKEEHGHDGAAHAAHA